MDDTNLKIVEYINLGQLLHNSDTLIPEMNGLNQLDLCRLEDTRHMRTD